MCMHVYISELTHKVKKDQENEALGIVWIMIQNSTVQKLLIIITKKQ